MEPNDIGRDQIDADLAHLAEENRRLRGVLRRIANLSIWTAGDAAVWARAALGETNEGPEAKP